MSQYLCHDFKSPRTDTSRRLPSTFRFIPIAFYAAVVLGSYFIAMDVMKGRKAKAAMQASEQVRAEHEAATAKYESEKLAIDVERAKAEALAKWVEGTRVLQPICVEVGRAVKGEVRIADFSLDRSPDLPAQIDLTMRLTGADANSLQHIERSIEGLSYRSYSPQQDRNGGVIDYRSTLVFVND